MSEATKRPSKTDQCMHYFAEGYSLGSELTEHQVERHFMLRLLRRRCGKLTEQLEELVYALPDETLHQLADDFFEFTSRTDLRKWLRAKMKADQNLRIYMKPHSIDFLGHL